MKIQDLDKVNHLIGELNRVKELIADVDRADPAECELFVKLPGDSSVKMSADGSASTHYEGFSVSLEFLRRLRILAVEELDGRRREIIAALAALGVDAEA